MIETKGWLFTNVTDALKKVLWCKNHKMKTSYYSCEDLNIWIVEVLDK